MNQKRCRHCGERLIYSGDAFCSFCHEPIDDEPLLEELNAEAPTTRGPSVRGGLFADSCYTRDTLVFKRCYKCDSSSDLATTSVGTSSRSLASYLFIFLRLIELLKNRTSVQIPICNSCRFSIWPIRIVHLVLLSACFLVPYLFNFAKARNNIMELGIILIVVGPMIALTSYVFFRDRLLGVQVHGAPDGYQYIVAKRFRADFEHDLKQQSDCSKSNEGQL